MNKNIGFIGCGNMGGALVTAVSKALSSKQIYVYDKDSAKALDYQNRLGVKAADLDEIFNACDYIFLGVKPQVLPSLLNNVKSLLSNQSKRTVLISMAAGTPCDKIFNIVGNDQPIIRIMPNLAVSVGEGMILYSSYYVEETELQEFNAFMSNAGKLCQIDEKLIDAGSAVSGCGPAYVYMMIEALADGGVRCGLTRSTAQLLAAQTLIGASKLLLESGKHPGELKDAVCSPGGTTIAGVLSLESNSFRGTVSDAVIAAYNRTLELKNN